MPKKRLSDIVFQRIGPPDAKENITPEDFANVLTRRLGIKRKESKANHALLLLELLKYRKDNIPLELEKISKILGVSQSQTYEELRKWRTLKLVEFVKIPAGSGFVKGYILTAPTLNRLLNNVEAAVKSFLRKTRRIAKEFDDLLLLEIARREKDRKETEKEEAAGATEPSS